MTCSENCRLRITRRGAIGKGGIVADRGGVGVGTRVLLLHGVDALLLLQLLVILLGLLAVGAGRRRRVAGSNVHDGGPRVAPPAGAPRVVV